LRLVKYVQVLDAFAFGVRACVAVPKAPDCSGGLYAHALGVFGYAAVPRLRLLLYAATPHTPSAWAASSVGEQR
jgi:hypothetical protein